MSSTNSAAVRCWRMAFLTLRDETLDSPPPPSALALVTTLLRSHSLDAFVSAAPHLPPHEVTSDLMLLAELITPASECPGAADAFLSVCHLIHDISRKVHLEVRSSYFTITLKFLKPMVEFVLLGADTKLYFSSTPGMTHVVEIVGILRFLVKMYAKSCSLSETVQLAGLLLHFLSCLPMDLIILPNSDILNSAGVGISNSICQTSLDVQLFGFTALGDTITRMGSSVPVDLWRSTLSVLRKVMDKIVSKNYLVEDHAMCRLYTVILNCLHLILLDPKGSFSEHVGGLVAALQMFFMYGVPYTSSPTLPATSSFNKKAPNIRNSMEGVSSSYRPPHLRKREGSSSHSLFAQRSPENGLYRCGFTSSDSEHSDSDGFAKEDDRFRSSKARVAAIICIQDLSRADPKSLASLWTTLLPTNDVLQRRKTQDTLMTSLVFDHVMKARIASASAVACLLDGHSSIFLQVAECKESTKFGSFLTLSSSLGQILIQLHRGILYLIQRESHVGLLASLFKVLTLVTSATPYSRMPAELLPNTIVAIKRKIAGSISFASDQINTLSAAFNCMSSALSTTPPSLHVSRLLEEEISGGQSSLFDFLVRSSQPEIHVTIRNEALQALRSLLHNYPSMANALWEQISTIVHGSLKILMPIASSIETKPSSGNGDSRNVLRSYDDRCIVASIKVLDECLRSLSGFRGIDGLLESRLLDGLDAQSLPGCSRNMKISCVPSYEFNDLKISTESSTEYSNGKRCWSEVIQKHLPLTLTHGSPMIRSASLTCFAGMTSSVFHSLTDPDKSYVISSITAAAVSDDVPSVRSAACRALGVVVCFPEIFSSFKVLSEFIHAAEKNTHDPLVSVRITSSWALANICDSLRCRTTDSNMKQAVGQFVDSTSISLLVESSLRLARDGDKVKSNAVRALGNISRFFIFTDYPTSSHELRDPSSSPHWLERMVQAFLSCVTTGNVKVQWNVCHALGNLFLNDTLKLKDMSWACSVYTILVLLLRDSTNFKIRINAAMALAVPASRADYGDSFVDVLQALELVLESLWSDRFSTSSNFEYKDTLQKQLTLTTLHVLGFASSRDGEILKSFLLKKATFLEEWLKSLSPSISEIHGERSDEAKFGTSEGCCSSLNKQKELISKALTSLVDVYSCSNNPRISGKFEELLDTLS